MKIKNIYCLGAGYIYGPILSVIAQKIIDIDVTVVDVYVQRIQDWNDFVKESKNSSLYKLYNIGNGKPSQKLEFIESLEKC